MEWIAATGNEHKLTEFRRILEPMGVEVISAVEAGVSLNVEETGKSFRENALLKAKAVYAQTKRTTFADDSGLCVDAMGGEPGLLSARFGGEDMPHSEKMQLILKRLEGIPNRKRRARFVAAVACILEDGTEIVCEGVCEGIIGRELRGTGGFGYDPIFMVDGRSLAELSDEEKDAIDHRGKALRALIKRLKEKRLL